MVQCPENTTYVQRDFELPGQEGAVTVYDSKNAPEIIYVRLLGSDKKLHPMLPPGVVSILPYYQKSVQVPIFWALSYQE